MLQSQLKFKHCLYKASWFQRSGSPSDSSLGGFSSRIASLLRGVAWRAAQHAGRLYQPGVHSHECHLLCREPRRAEAASIFVPDLRGGSRTSGLAALPREEQFAEPLGSGALGSLRTRVHSAGQRAHTHTHTPGCCCVPHPRCSPQPACASGALAVQLTQPSGVRQLEPSPQKV